MTRFDPDRPLSQAHTIPSSWYTDPAVYERERREIFARSWLPCGRADQLSDEGSFVTRRIAEEPYLVCRDKERNLGAFFNVCRHRATNVVNDACGRASRFRCRYHDWCYDLRGRLIGTPEFEGVEDFRKEDHGLLPVEVGAWGPLVFVSEAPDHDLSSLMAPVGKATALAGLKFHSRRTYRLACNWKVFVDNYLDGGYHVSSLHRSLASVIDDPSYKSQVYERSCLQSAPLKESPLDRSVDAVRKGKALYWWIWPNLMINIYDGLMDTNIVIPTGPESCEVEFDFYFDAAHWEKAEESIAVSHRVQLEDEEICESVQRGLRSSSFDTGRFSVKREAGGHHFHRLIARAMGEASQLVVAQDGSDNTRPLA